MHHLPLQTQTDPPLRLLVAFQQIYPGRSPTLIVQAPGREMWVAALTGQNRQFTLHAPDLDSRAVFTWQTAKTRRTVLNRPLPRWARYPAGVIYNLCSAGLDIAGIDAILVGEESHGPRYDHAMGMAIAALWYELHRQPYTSGSLLDIVEQVRRDYIDGS
jgi:hypothetical protein